MQNNLINKASCMLNNSERRKNLLTYLNPLFQTENIDDNPIKYRFV